MRNTTRNIGYGQGEVPRGACRFCVHSSNGASGMAKICILNYQCEHCAFDQWLEATQATGSVPMTFRTPGLGHTLARAV
jgi:hypothetical protein